jgi:two-component system, OmpR family, response regulator
MEQGMSEHEQPKVLIVDDEQDVRFLFGRIMLKRNVEAGFAKNLTEATECVQEDTPSLIFLDNSLPDGSGIDFIPYLKKNYPGMLIVVITANDSPMDRKVALQQGADAFLGKPLSLDLINRTLDMMKDLNRTA